MTLPQPTDPQDARFCALGRLVEHAAVMEIALRMAFCVLLGSPYAAIVAADQETHWLIENCDAIARDHQDVTPEQRDQIRAALRACRLANRERNRLVHDAWGTGPSGAPAEVQSLRNRYPIAGRDWSPAEVAAAADAVAGARDALLTSIEDSFGADTLEATGQLLGRQRAD